MTSTGLYAVRRGSNTDLPGPHEGPYRWRSSMTPFLRRIAGVLVAVLALLGPAGIARAAASKAQVLSSWTQPTATSTNAWNAARLDRAPWASYRFDWSTDYCSSSPDNP